MKKLFDTHALFLVLGLVAFAPAALSAPPPSSVEPGMLTKSTPLTDRAPSHLGAIVSVPETKGAQGLSTKKVFVLNGVVLDNSTVYRDKDLTPLYKDFLGQMVSFADLNTIAQRITRKYREDGYIFSRAILPPQKVGGGIVHLRAIEGKIINVTLVGNFHDGNGLIHEMADKIKSSGAANTKEIERYLLLIDDLPGITARSFVKPSATEGGGDLVIDVEEQKFEGSASFDDRGSKFLGPYRGTLVGAFNDVLGLHDRTTLRGILTTQTHEMRFADITHEEQIGPDGLKVKGRIAVTGSNPDIPASPSIDGDSILYDLEADYPVMRGRQWNFNLVGGFDALNSSTDVTGVRLATDRVRSLRAGTSFDFTDPLKGVNQFDLLAYKGISVFDATSNSNTPNRSRANGDQNFIKGTLTGTRVQDLFDLWSVMLSGTGQVSAEPLLASEEFTVGGPTYGRAYDQGEISGDSGYAGVAELRYGGPVHTQWVQSYQAYTYIDYGRVYNRNPQVGEVAQQSLTSAGIGLRFNVIHDWTGYVELDKPMSRTVASEGDREPRLFFSVLKRF